MSTQGSPPKTVNMAPPGGLLGSHRRGDDISESPDKSSRHATPKHSQFGIHLNQYHPPQGYGYLPSQQSFLGAPQFYHQSPFNMTHCSQPTSSTNQRYPGYGPPWQGYDLHQGGYGGSLMFPTPQFPGQGLSSPGAPRVPPGPPGNHTVNLPTSSSSTPPPQPPSGAPGRHPISPPTRRFQAPAELRKPDAAGIADFPQVPELSYDEYDTAEESDDLSDLGGAQGKPPNSLKQTEFSLKQFAKSMGQANYSPFNKWKKVWVAGFPEKMHQSCIRGQNRFEQVRDGPLHCETAVADCLATFETWLALVNFDTAEWIRRQWVEILLRSCASET